MSEEITTKQFSRTESAFIKTWLRLYNKECAAKEKRVRHEAQVSEALTDLRVGMTIEIPAEFTEDGECDWYGKLDRFKVTGILAAAPNIGGSISIECVTRRLYKNGRTGSPKTWHLGSRSGVDWIEVEGGK